MSSKTYTGGCHCRSIRYTVPISPPLEEGHGVVACNCSICDINGYLMSFIDSSNITWEQGGKAKLKEYSFGKKMYTHFFCPECGTSMGASGKNGGKVMMALNVRTIDNIDVPKLTLHPYDGKAL